MTGTISMRQAALRLNIGRNKLFRSLRELGILSPANRPYRKYIDAGYFIVYSRLKYTSSGWETFDVTTVTGTGLAYLRSILRQGEGEPQLQNEKEFVHELR